MKINRVITITLAVLLAVVYLPSCKQLPAQVAQQQEEESNKDYDANQLYMILASRRKEIREVFTNEIFDVKVNEQGDTYDRAFEEMIRNYATEVYIMTQMCKDRGIEMSTTGQRDISARAQKFLKDFETSGNVYDITEDEVAGILMDIELIGLLKENIIREAGIEISDAEARVMDICMITLDDSETAYELIEEVNAEDADFEAIARRNSTDSKIELQVGKGDLDPSVEEIVLSLEDEEISPILQAGGKYYIVKCINGNDLEATAARKEVMTRESEAEAVAKAFDEYAKEHEYVIPEETWKQAANMCIKNPECPDIFEY